MSPEELSRWRQRAARRSDPLEEARRALADALERSGGAPTGEVAAARERLARLLTPDDVEREREAAEDRVADAFWAGAHALGRGEPPDADGLAESVERLRRAEEEDRLRRESEEEGV